MADDTQRPRDDGLAIEIVNCSSRALAVVRKRTTWTAFHALIAPSFDLVHARLREVGAGQLGQNVIVYRPEGGGVVEVEYGVEVDPAMAKLGPAEVVHSQTPAGRAIAKVHIGPYHRLIESHRAVLEWARERNHPLAGPSWERYGDHHEDPAQLRTEIFHLLAISATDATA